MDKKLHRETYKVLWPIGVYNDRGTNENYLFHFHFKQIYTEVVPSLSYFLSTIPPTHSAHLNKAFCPPSADLGQGRLTKLWKKRCNREGDWSSENAFGGKNGVLRDV